MGWDATRFWPCASRFAILLRYFKGRPRKQSEGHYCHRPSFPAERGKGADVRPIDDAIPGWAKANSTTESPIIVVDMYTGFDPATESGDGIHPNAAGTQFMVDRWFDALSPLIKNH